MKKRKNDDETIADNDERRDFNKNTTALNDRTVFVGGVPRDARDSDGLRLSMNNRIFESWAHASFPGQVLLAKLRVNAKTKSMGYGFLTFDTPENAEKVLKKGRVAFGSSFVEIKAIVKRSDAGAKVVKMGICNFTKKLRSNSAGCSQSNDDILDDRLCSKFRSSIT